MAQHDASDHAHPRAGLVEPADGPNDDFGGPVPVPECSYMQSKAEFGWERDAIRAPKAGLNRRLHLSPGIRGKL